MNPAVNKEMEEEIIYNRWKEALEAEPIEGWSRERIQGKEERAQWRQDGDVKDRPTFPFLGFYSWDVTARQKRRLQEIPRDERNQFLQPRQSY